VHRRGFLKMASGVTIGSALAAEAWGDVTGEFHPSTVLAQPTGLAAGADWNGNVLPWDIAALRASVTAYPGETVGLWGKLPELPAKAIAKAVKWRGRPEETKTMVWSGSRQAAFATYPFDECRPVHVQMESGLEVWINRPRVDWLEHAEVNAGQRLRLFGRNLDCTESVVLRSAKGVLAHPVILDAAPYLLDLRVPNGLDGDCTLLLDSQECGRITVKEMAADPLGLQVAWADQFLWNRVTEVSHDQLKAADCTETLQALLDAAGRADGGVLRLPEGEIPIRTLQIPEGVVLMGRGAGLTTLKYLGGEPEGKTWKAQSIYKNGKIVEWGPAHVMLKGTTGRIGVARMSFVCDIPAPNDEIRRVDGYVQAIRIDAGNARYLFASDLQIRFACGSGIMLAALSDIVVQRCTAVVPCTGLHIATREMNGRAAVRYCTVENLQRPLLMMYASRSVIECNRFAGRNRVLPWCNGEHRIADLGPSSGHGTYTHQYVADNLAEGIFGTPHENDGEGIAWQGALRLAYAKVTDAGRDFMEDNSQSFATDALKGTTIAIVRGPGLGQIRRVAGNSATRIEVTQPWAVVPEAGSVYTVDKCISAAGCIIVRNTISGVKKRAIDLYCKNYDNWIQQNVTVDAGGIFLNATENIQQRRLDYAYFNVVRDNEIAGQATDPSTGLPQQSLLPTDHGLNWGIRVGNITRISRSDQMPSVAVLGNEIRSNTVRGPLPDERAAAIIVGIETHNVETDGAVGNLIEANRFEDVPVGVRLGTGAVQTKLSANHCLGSHGESKCVETGGPM